MADDPSADDRIGAAVSARTERALAALLAIEAGAAERVREQSPARRRAGPQYGPQLDLGAGVTERAAASGDVDAGDGSAEPSTDPDLPA